jgi:hypothetical protein
VFCSFLALLLKLALESRIKQAELKWKWAEVIRGLDKPATGRGSLSGQTLLYRSQLQAQASQAIRAGGVALPPTLRELQ